MRIEKTIYFKYEVNNNLEAKENAVKISECFKNCHYDFVESIEIENKNDFENLFNELSKLINDIGAKRVQLTLYLISHGKLENKEFHIELPQEKSVSMDGLLSRIKDLK